MNLNIKELNKISISIYKLFAEKFKTIYRDTDWSNVHKAIKVIQDMPNVTDVTASSGVYHNYVDFDGDKNPFRDYQLEITTKYGIINGYIRCCSAGTKEDPFSAYDMLILLNISKKITESLNEGKSTGVNFKGLILELKKAKNLKDVKRIAKKYLTEGIVAGTLLTIILCNFSLDVNSKQELVREIYNYEVTRNADLDEYENDERTFSLGQSSEQSKKVQIKDVKEEKKPIWVKLCSDVETTVYHAVAAQCNSNPSVTASMFLLNMNNPLGHKIIAMERTMMKQYGLKYGDLVKIEGTGKRDGVYQIQDTMNKRFAGKHKIDILINQGTGLGHWYNITIYKLDNAKDFEASFKKDMLKALNQKSIDKRQASRLNESFDNDLDDDLDGDINITKKSLSTIIKNNLYVDWDVILDLIAKVFKVEKDSILTKQSSKDTNLYWAGCTTQSENNLYPNNWLFFWNSYTKEMHFGRANSWAQCKWFNFTPEMIKFIEAYQYGNIELGEISIVYRKDRKEMSQEMLDSVTRNWVNKGGDWTYLEVYEAFAFYRGLYENEKYRMPNIGSIDDISRNKEIYQKLKISPAFTRHFTKFKSIANTLYKLNNEFIVNIHINLFENVGTYKDFVKILLQSNYSVSDEFGNIYRGISDLDAISNSLLIGSNKDIEQSEINLKEMNNRELQYLIDNINSFKKEIRKKYGKALLYKFLEVSDGNNFFGLRSMSHFLGFQNFYIDDFINDNINIDDIIKNSEKNFTNLLITEINNVINLNITDEAKIIKLINAGKTTFFRELRPANINNLMQELENNGIPQQFINLLYNTNGIFNYLGYSIGDNEKISKRFLVQRFYYVLNNKIINDVKDGIIVNSDILNLRLNNISIINNLVNTYSSYNYNIVSTRLLFNTIEKLFYFYYAISYALVNAFNNTEYLCPMYIVYNDTTEINKFTKLVDKNIIPELSKIKFDNINNTIINYIEYKYNKSIKLIKSNIEKAKWNAKQNNIIDDDLN